MEILDFLFELKKYIFYAISNICWQFKLKFQGVF